MGVGTPPSTSDLASDLRIRGVGHGCFNVSSLEDVDPVGVGLRVLQVVDVAQLHELMTWEERDFDETRLYHNTDMYVHI